MNLDAKLLEELININESELDSKVNYLKPRLNIIINQWFNYFKNTDKNLDKDTFEFILFEKSEPMTTFCDIYMKITKMSDYDIAWNIVNNMVLLLFNKDCFKEFYN